MDPLLKDPRLKIRRMESADVNAVMAIERRTYDFPWTDGIFRDCIKAGYHCLVFALDNLVIGYGVMSVVVPVGEAHVLNVSIEPRMQSRGLGRRMMKRMLSLAAEKGADSVFLEVRPSNRAALDLYRSLGFNELGTRRGYYPTANGREDAILFGITVASASEEGLPS